MLRWLEAAPHDARALSVALVSLATSLVSPLPASAQTVGERATAHGCTTSAIEDWGLLAQLGRAQACMDPSGLVELRPGGSLTFADRGPHFSTPQARDALYGARDTGVAIQVNSAFRNLLEQYWLYIATSPACGAVATPGSSNHESGSAFDIQEYASARAALEARGCDWPNIASDPWHFDCAPSPRRTVLHFQRLWNLNNPGDRIDEDNVWGPQTQARLRASPIAGFADDGCGPPPTPDAGPPATPDAGSPSSPDAGPASTPDAGVPSGVDAAVELVDASPFDASLEVGPRPATLSTSCACRLGAGASSRAPWTILGLLGALLARRRRARRAVSALGALRAGARSRRVARP